MTILYEMRNCHINTLDNSVYTKTSMQKHAGFESFTLYPI